MSDPSTAAAKAEADRLRARLRELETRLSPPRPVTRADLAGMTVSQINEAFEAGRLDDVLGATGTRHATGPLTDEELRDPHRIPYRRLARAGNLARLERHLAEQAAADAERARVDATIAETTAEYRRVAGDNRYLQRDRDDAAGRLALIDLKETTR